VPTGGVELIFSDNYDEYDADIIETSSDMSDDLTDILTDSDDMGDEDVDAEGLGQRAAGARVTKLQQEVEEPLDEDAPEVQDEEDELFDVPPATVRVTGDQGLTNGTAAAVGGHGSRPAKEAALRKLAELGMQEHPKLSAMV
jgi:hypothetical protein